ncbi:hypothetical protein Scep_012651 [Stephania cephalantha]|uniref:Caffeoyl-CoA O-methyltransferase n=1 Tax=Stephania cephalantha TaxID=152367 RepID=A0AAP0JFI6_9MAGN
MCTEQIRPKCRRFFSPSNFMKFEKDESGIIAILPFYLYVMRTGDEFDFVFVDADKPNYIKYHEILVKLVKVGGLIGYDNTLWFKCVALPDEEVPEYMMKNRNALKELNSYLASDARIEISNIMHLHCSKAPFTLQCRMRVFAGRSSYFLLHLMGKSKHGSMIAWDPVDYDAPGLWCTTMAYSAD